MRSLRLIADLGKPTLGGLDATVDLDALGLRRALVEGLTAWDAA
ncbi:hypothetical protein [Terracoccus luteus]|nr:hypothetical protein [Terracoccus luteus]